MCINVGMPNGIAKKDSAYAKSFFGDPDEI